MKIPFLDLKKQYASIKNEVDSAIQEVIEKSAYIGGPFVKSFEDNFAKYIGVGHCIGVGNGTDALYIAMKMLGMGEGDEVITAANTFVATSESITRADARVKFVDCDAETFNIDPNKIEASITKKTKAIIPVHLYGQPAEMDGISRIAQACKLHIIEDAAQAHGARLKDKSVGQFGVCATFSFFPGKNLGAYGDAGAITTNDSGFAQKMRMFADHGRIKKYDHEFEGINSRLDSLQAAILDVKLRHLEKWTERRRTVARIYDENLKGLVVTPRTLSGARHVYHQYVIQVDHREKIREFLQEQGISTGIHYPIPLPFLNAYRHLGLRDLDFPVAFSLKDKILSLPIHADMTDDQVDYVVTRVGQAVKRVS